MQPFEFGYTLSARGNGIQNKGYILERVGLKITGRCMKPQACGGLRDHSSANEESTAKLSVDGTQATRN